MLNNHPNVSDEARQPVYEKGQTAANMLDQIEPPDAEPVHTELDPKFIVRKSCGENS